MCAAWCFPWFSHGHQTRSGLCTYLKVQSTLYIYIFLFLVLPTFPVFEWPTWHAWIVWGRGGSICEVTHRWSHALVNPIGSVVPRRSSFSWKLSEFQSMPWDSVFNNRFHFYQQVPLFRPRFHDCGNSRTLGMTLSVALTPNMLSAVQMKSWLCVFSSYNATTPASCHHKHRGPLRSDHRPPLLIAPVRQMWWRSTPPPRLGLSFHLTPVTKILYGIICVFKAGQNIPASLSKGQLFRTRQWCRGWSSSDVIEY